jgi:hypothetical protein
MKGFVVCKLVFTKCYWENKTRIVVMGRACSTHEKIDTNEITLRRLRRGHEENIKMDIF